MVSYLRSLRRRQPPAAAADEIARLRAEVAELRRIVMSGRQVDLVDFGELKAFMYTDDLGYGLLEARYKGHTPGKDKRDLSVPFRSPEERYRRPDTPLLPLLLSHYWVHELPFAVFDVGCQYGISAMATAQVILASGRDNRVYAFDPGVAGQLAEANIRLNGLERRVRYERLAVSNGSYPTMLFTELGHSENNRVVNRTRPEEAQSYVVDCVSLDGYAATHDIREHLIVKIDTQGGEVEVFAGMANLLATRHVTSITEFVPAAIATRADPARWLGEVARDSFLFDLRDLNIYLTPRPSLEEVDREALGAFVAGVAARPAPYTDLLMVPRALPGAGDLRTRLLGADAG